jgi:hypothetical protein
MEYVCVQQNGFILIDSEIHLLIIAIKSFKYLGARRFIQVEILVF